MKQQQSYSQGQLPISMEDFQFIGSEQSERKAYSKIGDSDGYVSIRVKGEARGTGSAEIVFSQIFMEGVEYKKVAIGLSKTSSDAPIVMAFDMKDVGKEIRKYDNKSTKRSSFKYTAASRRMSESLIKAFRFPVPDVPSTSLRITFRLFPIKGQPRFFTVEPVEAMTIHADGKKVRKVLNKEEEKQNGLFDYDDFSKEVIRSTTPSPSKRF